MTNAPPKAKITRSPFEEGRKACDAGKSINDNPYQDDPAALRKWYEGWCAANARVFGERYGARSETQNAAER